MWFQVSEDQHQKKLLLAEMQAKDEYYAFLANGYVNSTTQILEPLLGIGYGFKTLELLLL